MNTENTELEEFIRLLNLHPELCPVLRQILEQQELPHGEQEAQPQRV